MPNPSSEEISGILERVTYQNEENGFTVARLKEPGKGRDLTTIVGPILGVPVGSTLRLSGYFENDSRHGIQFKITSYTILKPNTLNGMERYLGSGLIKGVGPAYAKRIVKHFGLATLDILEKDPDRLLEVRGLGKKLITSIKDAWVDQKQIHGVMVFLQGHGISATFAIKIYKTYGAQSLKVVQENPYRLAEDIWGIGFKIADRIALSLGVPVQDPRRARAGLLFALNEASDQGHCHMPMDDLLALGRELLELSPEVLENQIPALIEDERIVVEENNVYLAPLFYAERGVCRRILDLSRGTLVPADFDVDRALAKALKKLHITLAPEQDQALRMALKSSFSVITGGPGTGKSTILKALILILESQGVHVKLAAPTGRAAKRLGEACGREAKTIHRLLEFDPSIYGFRCNEENPLNADLVIIDEVSMMDILLANSLIKAVAPGSSLLVVGDANQLPSVGPGNVLRDIIDSGMVPVTVLKRIFRQDEGSLISLNAARINQGESIDLLKDYQGEKDFYFIARQTPEAIEQEIISLCTTRLARKYGFDPFMDIQIVTPMRKGIIGAENLNLRLQETLNKDGERPEKTTGDFSTGLGRFRVGDRVMQIRNNYDKDVFNGDLGFVRYIDDNDQVLSVDFDGKKTSYEISELNELDLAYAITVHKSQGSEFPCIIFPVHTTHYPMLQRNLLYTGITRGRKLVIVIGTLKALGIAIHNNKELKRNTRLSVLLRKMARELSGPGISG
ncbi:MAG: ATP-dependent RecD-like DNA helicase [Proteobacteria bacterium]|nr:ATP-dependent RecD-like DNA helicase [Pseudomonadota bacterium]MBU1710921.1 ATP-dependent RecD-like DNA helicase [Pseudomonadota bacterium]